MTTPKVIHTKLTTYVSSDGDRSELTRNLTMFEKLNIGEFNKQLQNTLNKLEENTIVKLKILVNPDTNQFKLTLNGIPDSSLIFIASQNHTIRLKELYELAKLRATFNLSGKEQSLHTICLNLVHICKALNIQIVTGN